MCQALSHSFLQMPESKVTRVLAPCSCFTKSRTWHADRMP